MFQLPETPMRPNPGLTSRPNARVAEEGGCCFLLKDEALVPLFPPWELCHNILEPFSALQRWKL